MHVLSTNHVLLVIHCTVLALMPPGGEAEEVYGLQGQEVQMDPKVTAALSSITWKKEKDKVAEWDRSLGHDYYGRCLTENQCDLHNSTGVLVMKGLKQEDEGQYFAEINNKGPAKALQVIVLEPVSKPNMTTSCSETQCILTCVGEETKHTKYSWKENGKTTPGNTLTVQKSGEQSKTYTCVFSNPKSEEHSDPLTEMDLFPGPPVGPIIGGVLGGVLFIVLVAVAVYCGLGRRGGQNKQDTDGQENTPLQVVNATDTQNTQNAGGQAVQGKSINSLASLLIFQHFY
uniref:Ig-like domain-containing protein n=1 Tax=Scleropages formosus TaxID=113540 RepID=A0A8C9RXK6_SCLFO